jgi:D-alanyl-lipoteichoic acid acyltransferase DltB (MBOAT superfamily)
MPRVNFYRQKHRKMKLSKFIILMVVIISIGFLSYEFIGVFINDLYIHAISADRNLLENAGISLSMSKGQIQSRLD